MQNNIKLITLILFLNFFFLPKIVNIQNFESLSPALSRSNSLRIKGTKDEVTQKLSTGTRQLKAHELTYFGVSSPTNKTTDTNVTKSPFVQLSTKNKSSSVINSSLSSSSSSVSVKASHKTATNTQMSSKILVNHQKPDLIMHHQQKYDSTAAPELTSSEKKSMIEALDSCIDETKNLEPLYENLYQNNNNKQQYDRKLDLARDKIILDELTRAADEIMNVSIFYCVNNFFSANLLWACSIPIIITFVFVLM
jgi:hypothetical protein